MPTRRLPCGVRRHSIDLGDLACALLNPVLAERREPDRDRSADALGINGLRDRDKLHCGRIASDPIGGCGDLAQDGIPHGPERVEISHEAML
jgi:hypothetical protein